MVVLKLVKMQLVTKEILVAAMTETGIKAMGEGTGGDEGRRCGRC